MRSAGSIDVKDLVLGYPLYRHPLLDRVRSILGTVWPAARPPLKRVLEDVSFSIRPGEIVAILGMNGAGKTTLLKVLSGLLAPDGGSVRTQGRVLAALGMGVGFRPSLSGRENIIYGGLLFGLQRREIEALVPEIHAFSELGEALDRPYFTYSSGMRARLAFSLLASIPADIMILDETLGAGDGRFVTKCYARLRELLQSGRTILFVTHHLGEVARLAERVIVIQQGRMVFDGEVFAGLRVYEHMLAETRAQASVAAQSGAIAPAIRFLDRDGLPTTRAVVGRPLTVELTLSSREDIGRSFLVIRIMNVERGQLCSYLQLSRWRIVDADGDVGDDNVEVRAGRTRVVWTIPAWVAGEGSYAFDVYLGPPTDISVVHMASGRFWTSVARLAVGYDNCYMRGTATTMELPVSAVSVHRDERLPDAVASGRDAAAARRNSPC